MHIAGWARFDGDATFEQEVTNPRILK
jgi:hypothetical protein